MERADARYKSYADTLPEQTFKLLKTKQVQSNNFQSCTKPMLAMNFAVSSFRQLERLVSLRV
jgi:hypothetical protein